MGWRGTGDAFRRKGWRLGGNILESTVGRDGRILLTTCVYQPDWDLGNAHGVESRDKKSDAQVEDRQYRKWWPRKSINKCTIGCDWRSSRGKFHWGSGERFDPEKCEGRVSTAHVWIRGKRWISHEIAGWWSFEWVGNTFLERIDIYRENRKMHVSGYIYL